VVVLGCIKGGMFGTLVTWPMGGSMFCGEPDAAMVRARVRLGLVGWTAIDGGHVSSNEVGGWLLEMKLY
jgi:hypothetical protein